MLRENKPLVFTEGVLGGCHGIFIFWGPGLFLGRGCVWVGQWDSFFRKMFYTPRVSGSRSLEAEEFETNSLERQASFHLGVPTGFSAVDLRTHSIVRSLFSLRI